jgi:hypothetical protein
MHLAGVVEAVAQGTQGVFAILSIHAISSRGCSFKIRKPTQSRQISGDQMQGDVIEQKDEIRTANLGSDDLGLHGRVGVEDAGAVQGPGDGAFAIRTLAGSGLVGPVGKHGQCAMVAAAMGGGEANGDRA